MRIIGANLGIECILPLSSSAKILTTAVSFYLIEMISYSFVNLE